MRVFRWTMAIVTIVAIGTFIVWPRSVKAIVENNGTKNMRDVRIVVTGRTYDLGDLAPGTNRAAYVRPKSESNIVVTYADNNGTKRRLPVECYLEPGYAGRITVEVSDGLVSKVSDQTRIGPW